MVSSEIERILPDVDAESTLYVADHNLRVVHTNEAWRRFAEENKGDLELTGPAYDSHLLDNMSGKARARWASIYRLLLDGNLPHYEERLRQQVGELMGWLGGLGVQLPEGALTHLLDPAKAMRVAGQMITGAGGLLANAFLILLTVIFLLLEASQLPAKLHAALDRPENSLEHLSRIATNINRYMAIKAVTSLSTGVCITLWLWYLGVDYPVLWGTVAFLLNFVPNIGSIIAAIPAVLLALVQLGIGTALWTAAGYLVVNILIGSVLEPKVMGRGLGLSTLVVFVSLVFWGWVLGPVGMFLSVPLTMTLKIALDSSPQTRPAAILLGSDASPLETVPEPVKEENA